MPLLQLRKRIHEIEYYGRHVCSEIDKVLAINYYPAFPACILLLQYRLSSN